MSEIAILNTAERDEAQFLGALTDALRGYNLSGKNFRKISSNLYSLMVDNYQIEVMQTGVFYYPNKIDKFLGNMKYDFKPGKYERYAVSVYKNRYPMHRYDSDELLLGTPIDTRLWRNNSYALFLRATMATNLGHYRTSCFDARPDDMFNKQNAHLFKDARRLYYILHDQESCAVDTKIIDKTPYEVKPFRDVFEMTKARDYLLHRIRSEKSNQQK